MNPAKRPRNKFPQALKDARTSLGLAQEAFSLASSRTYVSSLERGLKSPTLSKVDALAEVLGIHPLTLLTLSYLDGRQPTAADALTALVSKEVHQVLSASKPGQAQR